MPKKRSSDLARVCHSGCLVHPEMEMDSTTGEETSSKSNVSRGVHNLQGTVTFPRIASPQVAKILEIPVANHAKQPVQATEPLYSEVTAHKVKFRGFETFPPRYAL